VTGHDAALVLVGLGAALTVACCAGAALARTGPLGRLHFVTPITSLGCPLVAVGLTVEQGWGLTAASYLLVSAMLFFSGPVLTAAVGRLLGQEAGLVPPSDPE
jgi:hypothetical protein